jgi:hypothetical protein
MTGPSKLGAATNSAPMCRSQGLARPAIRPIRCCYRAPRAREPISADRADPEVSAPEERAALEKSPLAIPVTLLL